MEETKIINFNHYDEITLSLKKEFFAQKVIEIIKNNSNNKYDIITINVEKFKLVNDLFGKKMGNELLKHIANVLSKKFGNCCGRIGDDKFACLSLRCGKYENSFFDEIIREINEYAINIIVSVKFGIFAIKDANVPVEVMCDRAIIASNFIKGKYGVNFAFYEDKQRQILLDEQIITNEMKLALENGEFEVYYQPKYDVNNEKIIGAEALVRWNHPERGIISPNKFIPIFEKNGFICELDFYIWDIVCKDLCDWSLYKKNIFPISVNVSRNDIYNTDLFSILKNLLDKYKLNPQMLHLEITETSYTQNSNQLISVLNKLRNFGFIIEMDDFGSGYSSLNMLSELPINILKLDMKFFQNKLYEKNSNIILSFIINMAKLLSLPIVAEGVETKEQLEMLKKMHCNYAQGYYFARPMNKIDFENYIV